LEMIKVLIVIDQQDKRDSIIDALSNVEYISLTDGAETAEQALEILKQRHVDVALVDAYIAGNGHKLTEKITELFPGVAVIIIERELREETMRAALFSGAKDVLLLPFTPSSLVNAIYRSHQAEKKKLSLQRGKPLDHRKASRGVLITVFGTKGGIGKTFVATNLAVALAQQNDSSVALVDLDLDFGNAALALNIIPRFAISDVVNEISHLDQELLESYLISHNSGVKLLAADAEPQVSEFVTAEHVGLILNTLLVAFDFVVVDMPARFYEPVEPALREADLLLLVTTPEVVTLRNIKACLNTLAHYKYPVAKIKMLLNKVDSHDEIKLRDVEATLNNRVFATLQAEYRLVASSMNQGIPIVSLFPRSKISRGFTELASRISGMGKKVKPKTGVVDINEEDSLQEANH
jgi:pilus assembly protein CpaE